jgi:CAP12/Pycsar effector protein, TIR domain
MLRNEINRAEYCGADTWEDVFTSTAAQTKIEALEASVKVYDYAVIMFTEADLTTGQGSRSRDDCVFNAGLFMASLGRKRCILLNSVDKDALPSHLGGIISQKFTEPEDLKSHDKCRPAIQTAAGAIQAWVQRTETGLGPANRPLTHDEILERERMESAGGVLCEDQVVVASVQPRVLQYQAAKQVRTNMDNNIRYLYFFHGNLDATDKIPQLLQLVLLTDFLKEKDAGSFKTRRDLVDSHGDEIVGLLRDMCLNDTLNVFFLGDPTYPEFSIHNAASDKYARLYFKRDDDLFIEWASGDKAHRFWSMTKKRNGVDDQDLPFAIFHRGRDFGLNEETFKSNLLMKMRRHFGSIAEDVMGLCFYGPDYARVAVAK